MSALVDTTPAAKAVLRRLYPDGRDVPIGVAIGDVALVVELEEILRAAIEEIDPGMLLCHPGLAAALRAIAAVTLRKMRAKSPRMGRSGTSSDT